MIYGTPAGSLAHGSFGTATRRAIGAAGENMTATVINGFWADAEVFHDLQVPGFSINVDHAVLAGNKLLIIDSKTWKAGRYWSLGGSYFRGFQRSHTPSKAVAMARESYSLYLKPYGVEVVKPVVVLWTGSQAYGRRAYVNVKGEVTGVWAKHEARPIFHYHYPGAKVIPGNDLHERLRLFTRLNRRASDPGAVEALRHQLY